MDFEKLALVCGCAGLLGIIVILTSCLLCSCCWLSKKFTKRQRINDKNGKNYGLNSLELHSMDIGKPPTPAKTARSWTPIRLNKWYVKFHTRFLASTDGCSSSECLNKDYLTAIHLPDISDTKLQESETANNLFNQGKVAFTMQFKDNTHENGMTSPHLQILLREARDLPPRSYGGQCNPYFKFSLYEIKVLHEKKLGSVDALPICESHSTAVKQSLNPVYNESFHFSTENHDLNHCVLVIEALDEDKLVSDTVLGTAHFNLSEIATFLLNNPSKEIDIFLKLEEDKYNYGEILLGLCSFPKAGRMIVAVSKAINLMRLKETSKNVVYYIKAMTLYAGKIYETKYTSCKRASKLLVFNERLMFDVPSSKFDKMVILIAVHSMVESKLDKGENLKADGRNSCIGKVVIGAACRKPSLDHWNAVRNAPGRQVIKWHKLR